MNRIVAIDPSIDMLPITELINAAFATVAIEFGYTRDMAPTFPAYIDVKMMEAHVEKGLRLFTFMRDSSLAGCVGIRDIHSENIFTIEKLAVPPEYRHHGIGAELMRYALASIKAVGGRIAQVAIVDENRRLKGWYERQGFIETRVDRYPHLPFAVCLLDKAIAIA